MQKLTRPLLLEASIGVGLGILSFLLSMIMTDRALSVLGALFPLFLSISSLSTGGYLLSIILALASHFLLLNIDGTDSFLFFFPVICYLIAFRVSKLLTPLILGVAAYIGSINYPERLEFVYGVLFSCYLAGTIRRSSWWSNIIGASQPRGWLAFAVPLLVMSALAPFILNLLPDYLLSPYLLVITAASLGFLPNNDAPYDADSHRNILDSLLARPRGFSGFGKDFWERKDKEPVDAVALTSRLTTQLNLSEKVNPLSRYEAVCAITRGGRISFLNRKMREYLGIKVNQVVGKNIEELGIDPSTTSYLMRLVERTINLREQLGEIRISLPQGNRFFEVKTMKADALESSSLSDAPDSIIMVLTDITVRRTIEAQVLKSQKLETLGAISIKAIESLRKALSKLPSNLEKELEEIKDLTLQLDVFAQTSSTPKENTDVSLLIQNHLKVLSSTYPINLEISPNGRYQAYIDKAQVLQAVTNLILNAAESYESGRKGSVDISISNETLTEEVVGLQLGARPGEFVRIRVKDQGVGMTPDTLQKAFDPFFTTKAGSGHHGLGLSTVFAIVRDHDGFLTAESSSNSGTTISLYLPIST